MNRQFEKAAAEQEVKKPEVILPLWLQNGTYTSDDLLSDMKNPNFKYNLDKDAETGLSAGKAPGYVASRLLRLYTLAKGKGEVSMQHMAAVAFLAVVNDANPKPWERNIEIIARDMEDSTRAWMNARMILENLNNTEASSQTSTWQPYRACVHS